VGNQFERVLGEFLGGALLFLNAFRKKVLGQKGNVLATFA